MVYNIGKENKKMDIQKRYAELENNIVTYDELKSVASCNAITDTENFVPVERSGNLYAEWVLPFSAEMQAITPTTLVRETVYKKLRNVADTLKSQDRHLHLAVTWGWRDLNIQTRIWNENYQQLRPHYKTHEETVSATLKRIAEPSVAGHPTGGAVDVLLYDDRLKDYLNYGAKIYDFDAGKKHWTYSPEISGEALRNRLYLRELMQSEGFTPYNAEWWHYSYGDKTWAVDNKKDECLYSQKTLAQIENLM